jgi:hypothetical protein
MGGKTGNLADFRARYYLILSFPSNEEAEKELTRHTATAGSVSEQRPLGFGQLGPSRRLRLSRTLVPWAAATATDGRDGQAQQ